MLVAYWRLLFGWRLHYLQENAVLSYPGSKEDFRLQLPRFEVKPGEVAAVVGRVGSGEWRATGMAHCHSNKGGGLIRWSRTSPQGRVAAQA